MRLSGVLMLAAALGLTGNIHADDDARPENEYPRLMPVSGLQGSLRTVGSDTLENLTMLWAEQFKATYPVVEVKVEAAGSATAPPALLEGSADVAPMSRLMTDAEVSAFEQRHGYKPSPVVVAIDALAVYVHKDNQVPGLTLAEVDAIFSAGRDCGAPSAIDDWNILLPETGWEDSAILPYGRNSISGTNAYFRQHALCGGDFRDSLQEMPGSASLVRAVGASRNSIGYSGIGYATAAVRAVPLTRSPDRPFVEASPENALAGTYPLARLLYVYINRAPDQPLEEVTRAFVELALSDVGQKLVSRAGFSPLPPRFAHREMQKIQQQAEVKSE